MIGIFFAAAVLILDGLAILDVFGRVEAWRRKALWIALILLLPVAGPLAYYLLARRGFGLSVKS